MEPIVHLKGQEVRPTSEDAENFYFEHRTKRTAMEICARLSYMGHRAYMGHKGTSFFVRVAK